MDKLYSIGRKDLPPGLRAAQLTHACIEWTATHGRPPENLVLLEVEDEGALTALLEAVASFPHVVFHEPDLGGEFTALAVSHPDVPRLLSQLPLALRAA